VIANSLLFEGFAAKCTTFCGGGRYFRPRTDTVTIRLNSTGFSIAH
jgi:hypothetical protein